MRGGPRTPRIYSGNCMVHECNLPMRAGNFCNKHYLKDYFSREPRNGYDRGKRWVRRNTLIQEVYELSGLTYEKSIQVVNAVLETIADAIKHGEEVQIPGFGIFGSRINSKYKSGYQIYFLPAKELQEMMK